MRLTPADESGLSTGTIAAPGSQMTDMNIRRAGLLASSSVILLVSAVSAADAGIEFAGVLTAGGKTRVALTDKSSNATTWVAPGDEFNGYKVERYDPAEDAVFLAKGGKETRIGLVAAKTPEAGSVTTETQPSADAANAAIHANLQRLATAAKQLQLARGVSNVSYADLVGPGKPIPELNPVAGESYSTLSFGENVTAVSVTTSNGTTISLNLTPTALSSSSPSPIASGTSSNASARTEPAAGKRATSGVPAPGPIATDTSTPSPAAAAPAASSAAEPVLTPTGRQPASPSYMIQGGDTWEKISAGTGVPVQQLKQLNPTILEGAPLPFGQTIRVR